MRSVGAISTSSSPIKAWSVSTGKDKTCCPFGAAICKVSAWYFLVEGDREKEEMAKISRRNSSSVPQINVVQKSSDKNLDEHHSV